MSTPLISTKKLIKKVTETLESMTETLESIIDRLNAPVTLGTHINLHEQIVWDAHNIGELDYTCQSDGYIVTLKTNDFGGSFDVSVNDPAYAMTIPLDPPTAGRNYATYIRKGMSIHISAFCPTASMRNEFNIHFIPVQ